MSGPREDVMTQIEEKWAELKAQLSKVHANRMEDRGVVVPWSIKEVVGHITSWECEAIVSVYSYITERNTTAPAWKDDLAGFNLRAAEDTRSKTLDDLMANLYQTHAELLAFVAGAPDDALSADGVMNRIRESTFDHYAEHAISIRQWLDTDVVPS